METRTIYKKESGDGCLFSRIFELLPQSIKKSLAATDKRLIDGITEIRLRAGGISTVTVSGKSLVISESSVGAYMQMPVRLSEKDLDEFLHRVCGGSVYAYENSLAEGYITVNGIRMGLSGDVTVKNEKVCGFSKIRSINIRLPHHIADCADSLLEQLLKISFFDGHGGILAASAPGVGKTTLLRSLALRLSTGIRLTPQNTRIFRVTVVDERCELYIPALFSDSSADVLSGIPKNKGIEFANRVLAPEIIIFDEIGSDTDAEKILSAHFGGSIFISSVHASDISSVTDKKIIRRLADEGVFSYIYFLQPTDDGVRGTLHKIG